MTIEVWDWVNNLILHFTQYEISVDVMLVWSDVTLDADAVMLMQDTRG